MDTPRYFLAFDTSMAGCHVALLDAHTDRCETVSSDMLRGQAEQLVPIIDGLMEKLGLRYDELAAIGVTTGPGAFTGVRICLATARALSVALGIPVIGLTTLDMIAHTALQMPDVFKSKDEHLAVLIETKRKDYYIKVFDQRLDPVLEGTAMEADDVLEALSGSKPVLVVGDAVDRFEKEMKDRFGENVRFSAEFNLVDPQILAERTCALYHHAKTLGIDMPVAEPVYLRDADVSVSKRKKRKLETTT